MSKDDRRGRTTLIVFLASLFCIAAVAWLNQPLGRATIDQTAVRVVSTSDDFSFLHDPLPQWVMAVFTIVATFISWKAVVYVRDTLMATNRAVRAADDAVEATRETGRDQARAYLHVDGIEYLTGGRGRPTATATIKNSGQTPAKWFYLAGTANLYPIDYQLPHAIEVDRSAPNGITWNALGGGAELTAPIRIPDITIDAIKTASEEPVNHLLLVSGFVRYETYFSEIFESEFMFVSRPLPTFNSPKASPEQGAAQRKGHAVRITGEEPHKMQRVGRRLSSFKRLDAESS